MAKKVEDQASVNEVAAGHLLSNASDFLNGAIELLFAKDANERSAKIAIVSMQTAMELLAKYRLVRSEGVASIMESKPRSCISEAYLRKGNFRTLGYAQVLEALEGIEFLSDMDRELMKEVARLRNKLVHFTAEIDLKDIRITAAHLILKGLNRFAAEGRRDDGYFDTHRTILTTHNFSTLVTFRPYRDEAVDDATDSPDTEAVFRCWECEADALSLRASETYFCHCCGLVAQALVAKFAACCACDASDGVVYDPLNTTHGMHVGKCLHCGVRPFIKICELCGTVASQLEKRKRAMCEDCREPVTA